MLYGEDKVAVRPLNLQKRAAAAEKLRWPQGGPTFFCNILQAVGSPWNEIALLNIFFHFYARRSNSTSQAMM